VFGFIPRWAWSTTDGILRLCAAKGIHPAVYLRAFAENTKVPPANWNVSNVLLAPKWLENIEGTLHLMKEEASVKFDSDAIAFASALRLGVDVRAALENEAVDISSLARVHHCRAYGLAELSDEWLKAADIEALHNPFLAERYGR